VLLLFNHDEVLSDVKPDELKRIRIVACLSLAHIDIIMRLLSYSSFFLSSLYLSLFIMYRNVIIPYKLSKFSSIS